MKSAILYGPSDLKIEETDVPSAGPGEVLVRVKTALTCGTDVKVFLRGGASQNDNGSGAFRS